MEILGISKNLLSTKLRKFLQGCGNSQNCLEFGEFLRISISREFLGISPVAQAPVRFSIYDVEQQMASMNITMPALARDKFRV